MNEHAPSSLHNTGSQGHDKGHVGVHGITDQDLSRLNPVRYFMEVVRNIFLKGHGFSELWLHFTAIGVMQQRDAGSLDLDQPVADYLPWFAELEDVMELAEDLVCRVVGEVLAHNGDDLVLELNINVAQAALGDKVMIPTRVAAPDAPPIPVNYRLRLKDQEWKVYDVVIDGVSDVELEAESGDRPRHGHRAHGAEDPGHQPDERVLDGEDRDDLHAEFGSARLERPLTLPGVTCAGGAAPLDMMHALIAEAHGPALANRVSDWFLHTEIRPAGGPQRGGAAERWGVRHPKLIAAYEAMEAAVAEPLVKSGYGTYLLGLLADRPTSPVD